MDNKYLYCKVPGTVSIDVYKLLRLKSESNLVLVRIGNTNPLSSRLFFGETEICIYQGWPLQTPEEYHGK